MLTLPVDEFFDPSLFAEPAVYTETSGSIPVTINVIFTPPYQLSAIGGIGFQNENPEAVCRTVDVAASSPRSTLSIRSVIYTVRENQPDGTGVTKLILAKYDVRA